MVNTSSSFAAITGGRKMRTKPKTKSAAKKPMAGMAARMARMEAMERAEHKGMGAPKKGKKKGY